MSRRTIFVLLLCTKANVLNFIGKSLNLPLLLYRCHDAPGQEHVPPQLSLSRLHHQVVFVAQFEDEIANVEEFLSTIDTLRVLFQIRLLLNIFYKKHDGEIM